MFIAASFTKMKIWKQTKSPSTGEWIKKMCFIYFSIYLSLTYITYLQTYRDTHTHTHTMDYYSAIKENEILPFVTTCMDLRGIMCSEIIR